MEPLKTARKPTQSGMTRGYANPYLWYTVIPSVKFKCIREESSERSAKL